MPPPWRTQLLDHVPDEDFDADARLAGAAQCAGRSLQLASPDNFACLPGQAPPSPLPQAVLAQQN